MIPILLDNRAVVINNTDTISLIISDLHLGYHASLAGKIGVKIQSQHRAMLKQVKELIEKHGADSIFIIGDVKHTLEIDRAYNWEIVPEFMEELLKLGSVTIVPGNHDGGLESLLPRDVKVTDVHGTVIMQDHYKVGLIHGHAWPSVEVLGAGVIISGHGHPAIERIKRVRLPNSETMLTRKGKRIPVIIQSKMDKNCIRRSIGVREITNDSEAVLLNIPSFNPIIPGVAINKPEGGLIGPIFSRHCVDILRSKVFSTDGLFLGTVKAFQIK